MYTTEMLSGLSVAWAQFSWSKFSYLDYQGLRHVPLLFHN